MTCKSVIFLIFLFLIVDTVISQDYPLAPPDAPGKRYAPGALVLKFTKESFSQPHFHMKVENDRMTTGIASVDTLNRKYKARKFQPYYFELYNRDHDLAAGKDRIFIVYFPANADMELIAKLYQSNKNIVDAHPLRVFTTYATPNDDKYQDGSQWGLIKINASSAWDIHKGSSSVIIGIIDTGVDLDHPDLTSKLVSSTEWRDEVDVDTASWEARGYTLFPTEDYTTPDNTPQDTHGHGTHVAGIAAAETNNGEGVAGIAWNCKILPLRAGARYIYGGQIVLIFEEDDVARIIAYVTSTTPTKAHVLNMSFGGPNSERLYEDEIIDAYNNNVTLVAASGNKGDTEENYPANYSQVIAVGATNQNDARANFSSYGT